MLFFCFSDTEKTNFGKQYVKNFGYNNNGYPENVNLQLDGGF